MTRKKQRKTLGEGGLGSRTGVQRPAVTASSSQGRGVSQMATAGSFSTFNASMSAALVLNTQTPGQMSYNAVPPPAILTENSSSMNSERKKDPSTADPTSYHSSPSTVTGFHGSQDMTDLNANVNMPVHVDSMGAIANPTTTILSTIPAYVTTKDYNEEYMMHLRGFLHPKIVLEQNGFVVQQLSESSIERKKKCKRCGKAVQKSKPYDEENGGEGGREMKDRQRKNRSLQEKSSSEGVSGLNLDMLEELDSAVEQDVGLEEAEPGLDLNEKGKRGSTIEAGHALQQQRIHDSVTTSTQKQKIEQVLRCKFHDGLVAYKMWSCCRQHVSSDPCKAVERHIAREYPPGHLERSWRFYETPKSSKSSNICPAVAIDCEMGTAKSGDSELIRVTLIDYFSSAVLVDKLVFPDVEMAHYNTRYSGVTRGQMEHARRKGNCLMGKQRAREAVWQFVGPDTVVVGHAVENDLNALRWIHFLVIDTMLVETLPIKAARQKAQKEAEAEKIAKFKAWKEVKYKEWKDAQFDHEKEVSFRIWEKATIDTWKAEVNKTTIEQDKKNIAAAETEMPHKKPKGSGPHSLKTLTMTRWGREIQAKERLGHDSLEDAIAARDLAHWLVVNKRQGL